MNHRLVFDASTLARWAGPPVGIIRVERELARWARRHVERLVFVVFDPLAQAYRTIDPRWLDALIDGRVSVEPWSVPSASARRRRSDRIPPAFRPAANWVLQFRRSALLGLERQRLKAASELRRRAAEWLQARLTTEKYRAYLFHPDGRRRNIIAHDALAGPPLAFTADDVLVCAGAPWAHSDIQAIARLKQQHGFALALLCYDFIPVLFPQFYTADDARLFGRYYAAAFPAADLVIFTARAVERDTQAACRRLGLSLPRTAVIPLGADLPNSAGTARLPQGLEAGRYALFVSTIEPRKGHRMLTEVWLELLAEGVPQQHGFRLVFVGRPGWMMNDLLTRLATDPRLAGTLLVLHDAPDETLDALYAGAAFCLYPSVYEGFGLPVIEAFLRGKAVLASTGGAIPEVVAGLSPCLDPDDAAGWQAILTQWIADPAARAPHEAAIRARFRHVSWRESAVCFFAAVETLETQPAECEAV